MRSPNAVIIEFEGVTQFNKLQLTHVSSLLPTTAPTLFLSLILSFLPLLIYLLPRSDLLPGPQPWLLAQGEQLWGRRQLDDRHCHTGVRRGAAAAAPLHLVPWRFGQV